MEQWLPDYDSCRLFALNLYNIVKNPFTSKAEVDFDLLYSIVYEQQRLADDLIDLELEQINKIINKIVDDKESDDIRERELKMWKKIKEVCSKYRRTGCGITALGDMLAALGLKYDSQESLDITEKVMRKKMEAELDCTIDLAILRGTFEGWNTDLEFFEAESVLQDGMNSFYSFILSTFPSQSERMSNYGRRNISFSTIAPTGTVSLMTQTTSGCEPLFQPYYMRRTKINPNENKRVDFVDQNGDSWTEFAVLHPKFRDWIEINWWELMEDSIGTVADLNKETLKEFFEKSPWYKSTANDIDWIKRVEMQAILQKYTTNAISSTINLPNNISKEVVSDIYMACYDKGLKGATIYRDGCRTGVLVSDNKVNETKFEYRDSVKRPKELEADLHIVNVKGAKYGVVIGLIEDKPYEIFAFNLPSEIKDSAKGKLIKMKKGRYDFKSDEVNMSNIQLAAVRHEEQVLTRLVSGMLRHGAKPQFVMEQIDKCELEVVSFSKAVTRVLKKYCKEEEIVSRSKCSSCGSANLRMQEGCLTCLDCGNSKC